MAATSRRASRSRPAGAEGRLINWGINLGTIGDDPTLLAATCAPAQAKSPECAGAADARRQARLRACGTTSASSPVFRRRRPCRSGPRKCRSRSARSTSRMRAAYCLPQSAIPTTLPFPYKFLQTSDLIVHITEFTTPGYRQIFLDGRPHPPAEEWNPAWYGHSVGRWEGDTLVIDTVGFNEITPGFGVHTEKLHVVERFRRRTSAASKWKSPRRIPTRSPANTSSTSRRARFRTRKSSSSSAPRTIRTVTSSG